MMSHRNDLDGAAAAKVLCPNSVTATKHHLFEAKYAEKTSHTIISVNIWRFVCSHFKTIEPFLLAAPKRTEKKKMTTTKHNRMKKKIEGKKIKTPKKIECAWSWEENWKKKQRTSQTEMTRAREGKIMKGKKATRGMRATIKRRKKKIILNYLCCLLYDACGIRWASSNTVANAFELMPRQRMQVLQSIRYRLTCFSALVAFPFNSFRRRVLCATCLRRGKVKHIRHLVLHTIKYIYFFSLSLTLSLALVVIFIHFIA